MTPSDIDPLFHDAMSYLGWLLVLALMTTGLRTIFTPLLRGQAGEDMVCRSLAERGIEALNNVHLKDADGGWTQIDHVVNLGDKLAVIETKNMSGLITGARTSKTWTQHLAGGRRKIRFQNPIRQNYKHKKTLGLAVPSVDIADYVVFGADAKLGSGIPNDVVMPASKIGAHLKSLFQPPTENVTSAWARLAALHSDQDRSAAAREHMQGLRQRFGPDRRKGIAIVMIGASIGIAAALILFT